MSAICHVSHIFLKMKSYRILLIKKSVDFIRPHFLTFPEIRKDENINKCKNDSIHDQLPYGKGMPVKDAAENQRGQIKDEGFRDAVMDPFFEINPAYGGIN